MSAVPAAVDGCIRGAAQRDIAIVLLGTGQVGGAFLQLLRTDAGARIALVGAANSRHQETRAEPLAARRLRARLNLDGDARDDAALLAVLAANPAACRVIVDATASLDLAARHADWLARGFHVVTANKAAAGGALESWNALQSAGAVRYGDSATVGAGLPALATLRRLVACGDAILRIEGVFSGSLSYLFNRCDGVRPFSDLLREAAALGYTEPDPRADLSGEDVARKLLILARTAGCALDRSAVDVENLVPEPLRRVPREEFLARADELDATIGARLAAAHRHGTVLRSLAHFDPRQGKASVGLVEVASDHPAAHLLEADNLFAFHTARYAARPLVIQGAGAGPVVTAQALLGDILALVP